MRLEDQGKEVKKNGFLRGTRMWAIRNRIIAGFIGSALFFDFCCIMYARAKKDVIEEKHKQMHSVVQENQLQISRRVKALEERKIALQNSD